jgi:hypothetical protein
MLERLEHGDFYILCPDNEVTETDEKRILWAAGVLSKTDHRFHAGTQITLRRFRQLEKSR